MPLPCHFKTMDSRFRELGPSWPTNLLLNSHNHSLPVLPALRSETCLCHSITYPMQAPQQAQTTPDKHLSEINILLHTLPPLNIPDLQMSQMSYPQKCANTHTHTRTITQGENLYHHACAACNISAQSLCNIPHNTCSCTPLRLL